MRTGVATKVVAATMGLAGFAVAVVAGISADNPTDEVLWRAMVSMVVCHIVGLVIGAAGERAALEAIAAHERDHRADVRSAQPVSTAIGGGAVGGEDFA